MPDARDEPGERSSGVVDTAADDAGTGSAVPAAPLPPPATWGPEHEGPGSPAGSVRPPDTTGTAEPGDRRGTRPGALIILVAALVGAMIGTAGTLALSRVAPEMAGDVRAPIVEVAGEEGNVVPAVAEAVTPSVVRIDRFGTENGVPTEEGLGSGVIYRSDGYIITNNHVVDGADRLRVQLASGERLDAEIVGTDQLTDLAVLRIDRDGLPAISVREEAVGVGETAIAIGAPFGLNASVTTGVISGLDRSLEVPIEEGIVSIPNVIQTDAAINPGNSGGALVDASGRLVGINTAILATVQEFGQVPGNIGIGFAINAHDAVRIADQLIDEGTVRHARLGITGGTLNPRLAQEFDLEVTEGVIVDTAEPGGPADEAGVRSGDVIVAADGEPVRAMDELVAAIRRHEPGDILELEVIREGETLAIEVTLGEWDL